MKRSLATGRLVTLTGPGGVGKTRLALRVAGDRSRAFSGGTAFVQLADLHDPRLLPQAVARAFGLREQPGESATAVFIDRMGSQRALLVLDNCEHLLAVCAELTEDLLRGCPDLRVLATSRMPLSIPGEVTFAVPPLDLPDLEHLPAPVELQQCEAVSLFVDRAAAAVPSFRLTRENHEAVAGICCRLDGLPLAIELAAVRLRALSPAQIAERLSDEGRLLTRGRRTGPQHQQTLRASIDWSHRLCSTAEQRLWARLAVFSGGFELDAVEGVCADDDLPADSVLDLVSDLIDKSILIREEYRFGVRYRMLESFRAYAAERLDESGETATLRRRHRDWYVCLGRLAHEEWISRRQEYWLARMPHEQPNVRAAITHSLGVPGGAAQALRLLVDLPPAYLWARDLLGETRRTLKPVLDQVTEPSALRAHGLVLAAQLAIAQGDLESADAPLAEGWELGRRFADPAVLAFAGYASANLTMYRGDALAAMPFFTEALTACDRLPTLNQRLDILLAMAIAAGLAGQEERAVACHEEIVAITEPLGERFNRSNSLWALGLAAWRQDDVERSIALQERALRLKWEIDDRLGAALSAEALAAATVAEQPERAATLLGIADGLWRAGGTPRESHRHLAGDREVCIRKARQALGAAKYRAALVSGRVLDPDAALAYAVGDLLTPQAAGLASQPTMPHPRAAAVGSAVPFGKTPDVLTRREREVAELIGRGLSNKEIANDLVIAQRTAEGHVENILAKLGFTSRAQVAAWITTWRHQLG